MHVSFIVVSNKFVKLSRTLIEKEAFSWDISWNLNELKEGFFAWDWSNKVDELYVVN